MESKLINNYKGKKIVVHGSQFNFNNREIKIIITKDKNGKTITKEAGSGFYSLQNINIAIAYALGLYKNKINEIDPNKSFLNFFLVDDNLFIDDLKTVLYE